MGEAFASPEALATATVEGFTSQIERFEAGIEKGDAFGAAAGLGNVAGQALVVVEGAKGAPRLTAGPAPAFATVGGTIVRGGATVAITGGGGSAAAAGILISQHAKGAEATTVQEATPTEGNSSLTRRQPAIKKHKREGTRREHETQAELEQEHPHASVQREQLLRDAKGKKVKDPLTETGRRVDHVVIEGEGVTRSVETTSMTADKAAQIAKEQRIRQAGGNYVRDRRTRQVVPIKDDVTTEVRRRQ